jgi:hypothetical protein
MFQPEGFLLGKCLASNERHEIYAAVRESDGRAVVLKTARGALGSQGAKSLRREFEALRAVQGPGIVEALEFLPGTVPALVLARGAGLSLSAWLKGGRPRIEAFLEAAIQIAAAVERVHAARWIHCDLTPSNIMVEPRTLKTHLIDFGLAQPLGAQSHSIEVTHLAGTLAYLSPEQTGRMDRGIDSRSDLYSLGGTLYFMLTGEPPFPGDDALALIHAHLARVPRPPVEVRGDIPKVFSQMVLRLLEKEPENRYASARSLRADLLRCQKELQTRGQIGEDLALGTAEVADRLHFPVRLYGREEEIVRLRTLYVQAAEGSTQILMIAGEAGAGKSALLDALRPQLAESGGYLARGKFELSRDRPYAGWAAALGSFVQQLLVESDTRLAHWRTALGSALGNIAQVLVELAPDLKFVLGEVAPVPALGPRETQARLAFALRRFLAACATPEHPLVLFLDDLQWCDAASRALLEDLLRNETDSPLLVVGAYRSNEVDSTHPLARWLERLASEQVPLERLLLGPLPAESAVALLAEVLNRLPEAVRGLAELIERKTGNTPLLVRQFVEHLHEQDLLRYEPGSGWIWDPAAVTAANIPEGAVALMTAKFHRLEPEARAVLELTSCVAGEFDLALVSELSSLERTSLERGLYRLCDAGLIAPCPNGFRFVHERIREAARELLSEEARAQLHYKISQLLLARIPEAERPARIFEIAEHLSRGLVCLPESQRLDAIRLQLAAGQRALAAGAASSAEAFLTIGRRLLRDEDWHSEFALGFELLLQSAESAFLRSDFAASLALADALEQQTLSRLQEAQVAAKRLQVFALTRSPEEAVGYALEVLRRFGVRFPLRPSRLRAQLMLRFVCWRLRGHRLEAALRPTQRPDPRWITPILVIGAAGSTMARVSAYLVALASARVTSSNLRYGYVAGPAYALGAFATYVQVILGASEESDRIERAALAELARTPDPVDGPRTEFNLYALLHPWRMARRRALAPLERITGQLQEIGALEFAYYARFLKILYCALAGDPIASMGRALVELALEVRRSGHRYPEPELCQRPYQLLSAPDLSALEAELADSEAEITASRGSVEPYARTVWLMVLCVYGRFDLAFAQSEALGERLFSLVPYIHVAEHCFYRGLAAAALAGLARGADRRQYRRALRDNQRRLWRWAKSGPDFVHMALVLEAEQARLRRDHRRARVLYEKAARRATEQTFPNHAALAYERLARMLVDLRRRPEAVSAFAQAIGLYGEWGVPAKVAALEAEQSTLAASPTAWGKL